MARLVIPSSNLVVVGAWNPAIITPVWLRQQFPDLLPGDQYQAEFLAGPALAVRFTINGTQIDPSNGRLVLSRSTDDEGNFVVLPALAEAISVRLPHTPVAAVGFNFAFEAEPGIHLAVDRFLNEEEQNQFYAGLGLATHTGRQVTHSFALPQCTLNLTYEYRAEATKLMFNFHYNTVNGEQVRQALAGFAEMLAEARRLARAINPDQER